ncbi:PqqD family protein [Niabella insulamsoli]|uniref:PqqD family protein n=1 Tax=Niabella insulamsoli TaxID=3144874 RepID=UPI0031FE152F
MSYKFNSKDVLITALGNEGVAFNSSNNEYFSLNETSFKILRGLENNQTVSDICQQLLSEYNISEEACRKEVDQTIQLFLDKKLISEA